MNDYTILFRKDRMEFWPTEDMSRDRKLNSISRFIIVLTLLAFILTRRIHFIGIGIATLAIIVMYQSKQNEKEAFETPMNRTLPTENNPLMNVLLPQLNEDPNRRPAIMSYTRDGEKKINDEVKKLIPDPRIYQGINNEMDLEYSMRNFYTTASTTIPNDQDGFSKFCYGNMPSGKDGSKEALLANVPRSGPSIP